MLYYTRESQEVLDSLGANHNGLSEAEAQARLAKNGNNKLIEGEKISLFRRFLSQLADPMIIVLLVAAALSGVTSAYAGESFADVFIILFVVILNAVLGVVQESKAEEAIAALNSSNSITKLLLYNLFMHSCHSSSYTSDRFRMDRDHFYPAYHHWPYPAAKKPSLYLYYSFSGRRQYPPVL